MPKVKKQASKKVVSKKRRGRPKSLCPKTKTLSGVKLTPKALIFLQDVAAKAAPDITFAQWVRQSLFAQAYAAEKRLAKKGPRQ